jgi:hypothetical protein
MHVRQLSLAIAATLALAACSQGGNGPGPTGQKVAFSVATRPAGAAPAPAFAVAAAPETLAVGNDTIVFDTVQVLLRKVNLERSGATEDCETEQEGGSNSQNVAPITPTNGDDGHEDDCEEVAAGPIILPLPLSEGATHVFSVQVDTGTFGGVHFQIHKPTDDPADQALVTQHPEFVGISVRALGQFNGTAFSYTNDLTANQHMQFPSPISVTDATPIDLTIMVDLATWFKDQGGNLVDPASAATGQPNEGLVTDNIKNSFHAFKDHDHDGEDDDHEGGGHD